MSESRKAGNGLIAWLLTDPLGEEILEGTTGGLLTGAAQLGTDQPLAQTALQTAAAIAGGIGMGMIGRRLGAQIGRTVHAQPLKNQQGQLAMLGRTMGSETTAAGLKHQGQTMKAAVQESLVNSTSARMAQEAAADPAGFAARYGISPEQFERLMPQVQAGRMAAQAADVIGSMDPRQRQQLLDQLLGEYSTVEQAVTKEAAGSIDENIRRLADAFKDEGEIPGTKINVSEALGSMLNPAPPITGEHVGRMVGRVLGDEIGIIGGMVGGNLLAQQLGWESPKDAKIRELEKQLANRS